MMMKNFFLKRYRFADKKLHKHQHITQIKRSNYEMGMLIQDIQDELTEIINKRNNKKEDEL